MIPRITEDLPTEIIELIEQLGKKWKEYNRNNLFDSKILKHWEELIRNWAESEDLPLIIRNSRQTRGGVIIHTRQREIIIGDNSPAKWVAEMVFLKQTPELPDIKKFLENDQIPFKFAPIKGEQAKAKYKCISKNELNRSGWKLCHIESIGMKKQNDLANIDISLIKESFIRFMNPKNFFIVPKTLGGLGEIKWFIEQQ